MTPPSPPPALAQLGPVNQLGFVPRDYDAAIAFWTKTMGVGPFFEIMHFQLDHVGYRSAPASLDLSATIGFWGDMQIEILRQHCQSPSIYREWTLAGQAGIHHIGIPVQDHDAAVAMARAGGGVTVQDMRIEGVSEATYFAFQPDAPYVELYTFHGTQFTDLWARMRQASIGWDGRDPIRPISDLLPDGQ